MPRPSSRIDSGWDVAYFTSMHSKLGQMIQHHRKRRGLTQKTLADLAGVGKTVVFDVEHGKRSVQFDTMLKILKALAVRLLFRTQNMNIEFKEQ